MKSFMMKLKLNLPGKNLNFTIKIKLDETEIGSELKTLASNNQTIDEFKLSDIS